MIKRTYKILLNFIFIISIISCSEVNDFTGIKYSINDNDWKFIREDVPEANKIEFNVADWLSVTIPHDWNGGIDGIHDDVFTGPEMYMGPGWYRVNLNIENKYSDKQIFINFEAASLVCDVWLNGNYVGQHKGGYTGFSFNLTNDIIFGGNNILAVKVNNKNDSTVAPWMYKPFEKFPNGSDYAVYGGIYRDVWIEVKSDINVTKTLIETPKITSEEGLVNLRSSVVNKGAEEEVVLVKTTIYDTSNNIVGSSEVEHNADISSESVVKQSIKIKNPNLWSNLDPYLYKVKTVLLRNGKLLDESTNTFGFRNFNLNNGEAFSLNGEKLFLRGINRHQDREGFGYALTNEQHIEDVQLIKEYGFNFLRHAHYPADQSVLDACDSLGILVWLEIPTSTCISEDPGFLENAKSQLTEMIEQNYNHPSIVIWSIGNESDRAESSTETYSNGFLNELNNLSHSLDSTRPTGGCNFIHESNQKIVDVYAPQDWSGWYDEADHGYKNYNPNQFIGEYGSSIHIPNHNEYGSEEKWSQEYGSMLHEYKVSKGESLSDSFPGHAAWVAFDFASPRRDRGTNAIPFMNIKGLFLHDHKTPKDVAYFYKSFYTDGKLSPMVYIVSESWKDRVEVSTKKTVWVYSNCDEVELFNDLGKTSFGKRKRTAGPRSDTRFQWDNIQIDKNTLYAEGIVGGQTVAKDTLRFNR